MHSTRPIHTAKFIYGVGLVQEDGKSNGSWLRPNGLRPNSLDDRPLIINRDRNIMHTSIFVFLIL